MRTVKHVLVVDDEPAIVEIVRDHLSDAGYRVSTAHSGDEALSQVRSIRPDLIVLDLGLPGLDGLDVARTIRQSLGVPIIMLTARSDEADRVVGLELGADDYLVKPFSPRELLARIRAVLRRSSGADEPDAEDRALVVHELTVDPLRRLVTVGSTAIVVTATEFDLLAHMAAAPGEAARKGVRIAIRGHRRNVCRAHRGVEAGRSHRIHPPAHDPCVLANLPAAGESVLLEEFDGSAEKETARRLAARRHLGDGLDEAAAGMGDLVERAFQRHPCDALAAMFLVDVEAGDPPVRTPRRVLLVLALVLDARKFLGAAVLAPPLRGAVLVEDERGVSATCPNPALLDRAMADPLLAALRVVTNAPTSAEDPVVALDKFREGIPGVGVEGSAGVRHHRVLSSASDPMFPARELNLHDCSPLGRSGSPP